MSYQFKNVSVLIVESQRAMFDLTKSVLLTFGINQFYSAYNCDEGFNAFCNFEPDLVIIDWLEDPDNGLELTKRIRLDPKSKNPFTPIILMTGFSQKKRVMAARDSGITEFVVKPFTARILYQKIEQLIERPKNFVRCDTYFGPDRRHMRDGYDGSDRRATAPKPAAKKDVLSAVEKAKEIQRRKIEGTDKKKGD